MFEIQTQHFSGPMDLMLDLIAEEELAIEDIEIASITEKYLERLEAMDKEAEEISDFLAFASSLLYIKSQALLPAKEEEEGEEELSEELLKERLLEYKHYKDLAEKLTNLFADQEKHFYKVQEDLSVFQKQEEVAIDGDVSLLLDLMGQILDQEGQGSKDPFDLIRPDRYSVEETMEEICWRLVPEGRYQLGDFIQHPGDKEELITIFLALLELMKNKEIVIKQEKKVFQIELRIDEL